MDSGMPLPDGLIPVGSAVSATGNAGATNVRPPALPRGLLARTGVGKGQYEPVPWTEFFDSVEKINDTVPLYTAGS